MLKPFRRDALSRQATKMSLMRPMVVAVSLLATLAASPNARAQDPPPRIGPIVLDLRGSIINLPDSVAASRGLNPAEVPNRGLGLEAAFHTYVYKLAAVTFGLGGELLYNHAHGSPASTPDNTLHPVTSNLVSVAPQLSLNFGTGDGWSYISGGWGATRWSLVPDGASAQAADEAWVSTLDYGGGARWFMKPHLAFHFDVRFRSISAGAAGPTLPGTPRVNLFVIGVGASFK